jgi:hypothetical protein
MYLFSIALVTIFCQIQEECKAGMGCITLCGGDDPCRQFGFDMAYIQIEHFSGIFKSIYPKSQDS